MTQISKLSQAPPYGLFLTGLYLQSANLQKNLLQKSPSSFTFCTLPLIYVRPTLARAHASVAYDMYLSEIRNCFPEVNEFDQNTYATLKHSIRSGRRQSRAEEINLTALRGRKGSNTIAGMQMRGRVSSMAEKPKSTVFNPATPLSYECPIFVGPDTLPIHGGGKNYISNATLITTSDPSIWDMRGVSMLCNVPRV